MKQIEWLNNNKMKINTGHKEFDRQCNCLGTGNIIANTIIGNYIRPFTKTVGPVGQVEAPGFFQKYDLNSFRKVPLHLIKAIEEHGYDDYLILYEVFHHSGGKLIRHGWILTYGVSRNHELIRTDICGPTYRSYWVMQEVARYISNDPEEEERVNGTQSHAGI